MALQLSHAIQFCFIVYRSKKIIAQQLFFLTKSENDTQTWHLILSIYLKLPIKESAKVKKSGATTEMIAYADLGIVYSTPLGSVASV